WGFGALTWEGAGKEVRIPLAFRPEALAAPLVLSGAGASGELAIPLEFGYTGPFFARVEGLAVPQIVMGEVSDDPLDFYTFLENDAALPDHVRRYRITVPGGTRYLRVAAATLDEGAEDDIDLYVFCPERSCADGNEGYASTTTGAVEFVDIYEPLPGEYVIDIHGFETDDVVGGPGARFEMGTWLIAAAGGAGAPTVAVPAGATVGGGAEARLAWAGLEPGLSHLGLVVFSDGERDLGDTLVEIFSE
ncbi:MAG: hypothetical protein L6Q83_12340, partial [Gammaproteobacteria bacterium]|nr:hypothetical protein [Gammaproteobacteria bacterium]